MNPSMDLKEFGKIVDGVYASGVSLYIVYKLDGVGWKIHPGSGHGYGIETSHRTHTTIFSLSGNLASNTPIEKVLYFLQLVEDNKDTFLTAIYEVMNKKQTRYQKIIDKTEIGKDFLIENYGAHLIGHALKTPLEELNECKKIYFQ